MRRIFSIKDSSSLVRTAIKAGDPDDQFWKLIMSGEPAVRGGSRDSWESRLRNSDEVDDWSDNNDVFEFIFVYSPPKRIKNQLPLYLKMNKDVKLISVNQPSDEMNVVEVKVMARVEKEDAFDAIRNVLTEDLGLFIEEARG